MVLIRFDAEGDTVITPEMVQAKLASYPEQSAYVECTHACRIAPLAFERVKIRAVYFSDDLVRIDEKAFHRCPLEFLYASLCEQLETIGKDAFRQSGVRQAHLNHARLHTIAERTFRSSLLEEVYLPATLQRIQREAFYRTRLAHVDLSACDRLTEIGSHAFRQTPLKTVELPASISTVGWGAFAETLLEAVDLGACTRLTDLEGSTFADCRHLQDVVLPPRLQHIGNRTFRNTALQSCTFPSSLRSIGTHAFKDTLLKSVHLAACRHIDEYAFENVPCTTVVLPPSLRRLGRYAFRNTKIRELNIAHCRVVPTGLCDGCADLTRVVLHNTQNIHRKAFQGCARLGMVFAPQVAYIEKWAFRGCPRLKQFYVTQPPSLHEQAFGALPPKDLTFLNDDGDPVEMVEYDTDAQVHHLRL